MTAKIICQYQEWQSSHIHTFQIKKIRPMSLRTESRAASNANQMEKAILVISALKCRTARVISQDLMAARNSY